MNQYKTKQLPKISKQNSFNQGWQILIKHLGCVKAANFVMEFPKNYGDSVKTIRELRKEWKTADQLNQEITKAKKQKEF